jgi:hypothetical protein
MTSTDPGACFSITYEAQLEDLQDVIAARPQRRRRRARITFATAVWALIGVAFTAITVALDLPAVVRNSSGAPSWMYIVDVVMWFFVAKGAVVAWRLSPKRLARRVWRSNPQVRGSHHTEVGPSGISHIGPDATQMSTPWANIDRIRETENAFHLVNRRGATWSILPKRGLADPDLVPALREFLNHSTNRRQPPPIPDSGTDKFEILG